MALSNFFVRSPVNRTSPYREPAPPAPSRVVAADGRALPLVSTSLRATAAGGVARVVVEQRFRNVHAEALEVTYALPLPADGAVSGFAFTLGARRVVGEVDRRAAARERYERAIVEGKTAALLDQERSSAFTQRVGNVPPGEDVVAEVVVDQRLAWTDEGGWEWRFPTVLAPRYEGPPGGGSVAAAPAVEESAAPLATRAFVELALGDVLAEGARPESPSHAFAVESGRVTRLRLADAAGARLDRDVVVRWRVASARVGAAARAGRAPRGGGDGRRGLRARHLGAAGARGGPAAARARPHRLARHERLDGRRAARAGAPGRAARGCTRSASARRSTARSPGRRRARAGASRSSSASAKTPSGPPAGWSPAPTRPSSPSWRSRATACSTSRPSACPTFTPGRRRSWPSRCGPKGARCAWSG
jgi:Ca-activated chloride channel family protein